MGGLRARLASRNENKLRELRRSLGWDLALVETDEYPPEEGRTYYENARAKAVYGHTLAADEWVLGEDSGIEVAGLAGGPGVYSARFGAGEPVERLLHELEAVEGDGRRARYVCELVAVAPDGREARGTGILEGRIGTEALGSEGFGYDPIFVPEGEERTVAELGNDWKRDNSHRARAARDLARELREAGYLL